MCFVLIGYRDRAVRISMLLLWLDEKRIYKRKSVTREKLLSRILDAADLLKKSNCLLTIVTEPNLKVDEELLACFIDWQKAFDRAKWAKLKQILKETDVDWRERLISKLYVDQSVKVRLGRGETRSVQIGRGVRKGCCLSPILFKSYS